MRRTDARDDIVRYAHEVYRKGWVANHDGNLTVRLAEDRILATPTSFSKGDVTASDLIVLDRKGEKISGHRRSFSELALHLAVYGKRRDVKAVLHAHPPYATAMAVAGCGIDRPFIAEAVVSLGDRIPLLPFTLPKAPGWTASLEEACVYYDAVMLQNHGVLTWGDDLEQAFLRMELVEHLAKILHHSVAFGGPRYLEQAHVEALLAARKRAGLGAEARGLTPPHRASGAPAPSGPMAAVASRQHLVELITEEIARLQGKS